MNQKPKLSDFSDLMGKTVDILTGNWKFLLKVSLLLLLTNGAFASLNFASQLQSLTNNTQNLNWNLSETSAKNIVMEGIPVLGNVLGIQKKLTDSTPEENSNSEDQTETTDPYGRFEGQEGFYDTKIPNNLDKGALAAILGVGALVLILILIPFMVAGIIISTWGQTTALEGIIAKIWEKEIRVADCYKIGFKKIWGFFSTSFLLGIVVMLGLIFFIIPGIIFAFWYSLAPYVFLIEGKKGLSAMRRSKEIITGRILGYTGRRILFSFLSTVILAPIMGMIVGLTFATSKIAVFGSMLAFAFGIVSIAVSGAISIAGMIFNMLMVKELIETTPEMVKTKE